MKILGISREPEYSPGRHRSNDALLLEQVAAGLAARGAAVQILAMEAAVERRPAADLIISMCQGRVALNQLAQWEDAGALIVNAPRAALNTYRDRLPAILAKADVRFPSTRILATAKDADASLVNGRGLWLKRGDVHASVAADVQRVESFDALRRGLEEFHARGIAHAALQDHREGAEIKFYALSDGSFFHWFYTSQPGSCIVDPAALQLLGLRAARAAGLEIYGGDIVVEPSGRLTLIDLNDWPSFAPCREAASEAIAGYLVRRLDAVWNRGLVSSANESAV